MKKEKKTICTQRKQDRQAIQKYKCMNEKRAFIFPSVTNTPVDLIRKYRYDESRS